MPRKKTSVKNKVSRFLSPGLVDLHFHGAFGIDLMTASAEQMTELAQRLWSQGIAAFCPTTLSAPRRELAESVKRMGTWIRAQQSLHARQSRARKLPDAALPLGIHLEGPFVHPGACGAHPPSSIRPLDLDELHQLWESSQHTLKLLTIAPEDLSSDQLQSLVRFARERKVILSLGHSKATEAQAHAAFDAGFTGVTHAWNALPFHQRSPGALGAALGRANTHVELILDQVHVHPTVARWTLALHPKGTCFVSDCVPAAQTQAGTTHRFGSLQIQYSEGACRLPGGHLAGGGLLLSEAFRSWIRSEAAFRKVSQSQLLRTYLPCANRMPLAALGLKPSLLKGYRLQWYLDRQGRILALHPKKSGPSRRR